MRVNSIENYNYNKTFGAKLNITGEMFYGDVFDKMMEKASKIGTEKDIIEIKYVGNFSSNPKKASNKTKFSGTFIAKYIEKSNKKKEVEKARLDINDSSRYAYREKAKAAAVAYVDDLFAKYGK